MTYISIDRDQEFRLEQDQAIEEIYLDGIGDGARGDLPAMSEIVYLQGYCTGMQQGRAEIGLKITVSPQQLQSEIFKVENNPLLCGQCKYLTNRTCTIKSIKRDQSNFACTSVVIDSPF